MSSLDTILRMYFNQEDTRMKATLERFDKLIRCTADVVQSLHDAKIKLGEWEVYIESLAIKIIYAAQSLYTLAKGMKITNMKQSFKMEIIDRPSLFLLVRSIIEALLTLEYLYFNNEPNNVQEFRYKLWQVSGFKARQMEEIIGPPPPGIPDEYKKQREQHQKQLEDERILIERLMEEIKASPYYEHLTRTNKRNLERRGCPRIYTWNQLQEKSILNTTFLKKMYRLSSNHAHAEFLSAIQINELSPLVKDLDMVHAAKLSITFSSIILSTVTILFKDRFKCAEIIFNGLPRDQQHEMNHWYQIGVKGNFE